MISLEIVSEAGINEGAEGSRREFKTDITPSIRIVLDSARGSRLDLRTSEWE
jgi:hypothetical protein